MMFTFTVCAASFTIGFFVGIAFKFIFEKRVPSTFIGGPADGITISLPSSIEDIYVNGEYYELLEDGKFYFMVGNRDE